MRLLKEGLADRLLLPVDRTLLVLPAAPGQQFVKLLEGTQSRCRSICLWIRLRLRIGGGLGDGLAAEAALPGDLSDALFLRAK